jgi:peptide/nickel transport system substrate-binding protein
LRKSKLLATLSVVIFSAIVLSACSTSGATSPTSAAGKTLVVGQSTGVTELNPNITSLQSDFTPTLLLYSALTKEASNGSIEPDLAKGWTTSADGLTWTFTLRSGVTFHDGTPLTATDVVKSVQYVLDPKTASQWAAKISAISSVEATNATTVKFTLTTPSPRLDAGLTYVKIIRMDQLSQINKTGDGTGPYKLASFTPGQELDLVPNKNYFGKKPTLSEIKIVKYADETAAERALSTGEVSVLLAVPKNDLSTLVSKPSLKLVQPADPGGLSAFEVDTTSAPFNNVKARQALSYATDRKSLVKAGFAGYAVENDYNTIVSPSSPYFDHSLPKYSFNLDKAKALFAEAGVHSGDTITFWTIAGSYPEWTTMAEIMQSDLAKIGIKLDIKANETNTWLQAFYPDGKTYPATIVANQLSFAAAPDAFSAQWLGTNGTCECNWKGTAAYNAAVNVVSTSSNQKAVKSAFDTIQKIISQQVPILIIANVSSNAVTQSSVKGVWMQGDDVLHLEGASMD